MNQGRFLQLSVQYILRELTSKCACFLYSPLLLWRQSLEIFQRGCHWIHCFGNRSDNSPLRKRISCSGWDLQLVVITKCRCRRKNRKSCRMSYPPSILCCLWTCTLPLMWSVVTPWFLPCSLVSKFECWAIHVSPYQSSRDKFNLASQSIHTPMFSLEDSTMDRAANAIARGLNK